MKRCGNADRLNLLIDNTGNKAEGEGEWSACKRGGPKRSIWRKIHIGIDEETLEVRAVEVTGRNIGDEPILPDLLEQIPSDEEIGSVTADGPYDTRKCHEAIAAICAAAIIPPRKNAKPWKPTGPEPSPAIRLCVLPNIWVAPSGEDGLDPTAGAGSRAR